ncbi:type III secretion system cytoplasmic ring protein SctQ [Bradyrhizobium oligotrophicum]|uniref:type III secretion system cytoplasmic ring protein SctQ n=1 Tax=Bradyrhizobium oligotrophicum TaxID=44255 RepID=UPI003EBCA031
MNIAVSAGPPHSVAADRSAQPLPFHRLTPGEARLANVWHRRWRAKSVDIEGMRLQISPVGINDDSGKPAGTAIVFGVTIGSARVELVVHTAVIDRILTALSAPPRDGLSDTNMLLLVELAGAAMLDAMEQRLALPVVLTDLRVVASHEPAGGLALAGSLADLAFTAWLNWPPERADMLADLLGMPETVSAPDLPIDVALRVGTTRVSVGVLAGLVAGDVVIVDRSAHSDGRIAVICGERRLAFASLEGAGATLTTGLTPITGDMQRIWTPADLTIMNDDQTGSPELDDIEVTLLFEIGRLSVPLGELRSLEAGYVFQLGHDPKGAVEILTGGKRIGYGEVVQVGTAIGVRVVRIFGRD